MSAAEKLTKTGSQLNALELGERVADEIGRGVHDTFFNMINIKPIPGPYHVFRAADVDVKGDVSGIINATQETLSATLVVSFPKETIFFILEKMFQNKFTEIDQSVKEGVGEFTNIIYCVIKKNLNETGCNFRMAIPTVVIGATHLITAVQCDSTMVVPFTLQAHPFFVSLTLRKQQGDNS